jgi:hypothetical protein
MDPAPDPAIFILDLQDDNKKQFFVEIFLSFSFYYFLKVQLHHFSKIKSYKTVGVKVFLSFA